MAKFIMPFEDMPKELVTPQKAAPRYIIPFESEAEKVVSPEAKALAEKSPIQRGLIGAKQTLSDIGLGAKQLAGMVVGNKWPQEVADRLKSERAARQAIAQDPYSSAGRAAADIGLGMLTPSTRIPAMAVTGAAIGALTPQEEPSFGETLTQAGKGAALGAGAGMVGNALISAVGRGKNALRGQMANPEYGRRMSLFEQRNVPASLGDITQNPTVMSIENINQRIPGSGRREFLERQSAGIGDVVRGLPEEVAGATAPMTKENIGQTLSQSVKTKYKEVKDTAKSMYDAVSDRVAKINPPDINPDNLRATAIQLKNDYPDAFASFMDTKAVKRLDDIISGTGPQKSPILNQSGQPITTPATLSFEDARWLDKRLGSVIRQARQQMQQGKYDPEAFNQLTSLQSALRDDITAWSAKVGDPAIAKGVASANKYFRENVVPFRNSPLTKDIVQGMEVNLDTLPDKMFKIDSPWTTDQALQFLTPEGVQAGRYHLINKARSQAMDNALTGVTSPAKFLRKSELGETGPKLFSPEELQGLSDVQELVGLGRRAASFGVDPDTGGRLAGLMALAKPLVYPLSRASTAATQSPAVTKFLLSDPRLYTGAGGLGRASENLLRKSTVGAPEAAIDLMEQE